MPQIESNCYCGLYQLEFHSVLRVALTVLLKIDVPDPRPYCKARTIIDLLFSLGRRTNEAVYLLFGYTYS